MDVRSLILILAMANGFALAALLLTLRANRLANSLLAALIAVFTLRLAPHAIGFAGLYDAHRWLTFLPVDLSLTFGPLLRAYVLAITGAPSPRLAWHLAPGGLQLLYWTAAFALPPTAKWDWYTGAHLHLVAPLGVVAGLASAGFYLALAWRRRSDWRRSLDAEARELSGWLTAMLGLFGAALDASCAAAAFSLVVHPLSYPERFPLMLVLAALAYGLGLLGWRFGDRRYPRVPDASARGPAARPPDYAATVAGWTQRARQAGWARDEGLTSAALATRLGVSGRSLSRTLGEGAGVNFNVFINGLRVAAIAEALDRGDERDLLELALDEGFASKASFNRAFRSATGRTPSAYRRAAREGRNIRQNEPRPEIEAQPAAG